jgi:hypothetical protein
MEAVARIVARGKSQMRKSTGISAATWNRMSWAERRTAMGKADSDIRFSSKPTFPPDSDNQSLSNDPLADDGATRDAQRHPVPSQPFSTTMGGFTDSQVPQSDPRIRAAVALGSSGDAQGRDEAVEKIREALRHPRRLV